MTKRVLTWPDQQQLRQVLGDWDVIRQHAILFPVALGSRVTRTLPDNSVRVYELKGVFTNDPLTDTYDEFGEGTHWRRVLFQPVLYMQTRITDFTTNLNQLAPSDTPIAGAVVINRGGFSVTNNTHVVLPVSGFYEFSAHFSLLGAASVDRSNIEFRARVDDVDTGVFYRANYIRAMQGHLETSQGFPGYAFPAQAGQTLSFQHKKVSGKNGAITFDSEALNYVQIKYLGDF